MDESGSHGRLNNNAYVLAGVLVHESDAARLEKALTTVLERHLGPDVADYELHAAEIHRPRREAESPWTGVDGQTRSVILRELVAAVGTFTPSDPHNLFQLHAALAEPDSPTRERDCYEVVLNGVDDALTRHRPDERMIAISDVSDHERQLQTDATEWRRVAGRLGRLDRMVDVPLFADSQSTRLLQCADLVAWALWRRFGSERSNDSWLAPLWHHFEVREGMCTGFRRVTASGFESVAANALATAA